MANYVYNYLFCDEKAKDRMMILDGDDCSLLNGCYDIIVTSIKDSTVCARTCICKDERRRKLYPCRAILKQGSFPAPWGAETLSRYRRPFL